nr:hypothetical protein [uncultured Capnocytophaga sp.]
MSNNYDKPIFTDATPHTENNESAQSLPSYQHFDNNEPPKGGGILSKIIIALLALATGGLGYYTYLLNKDKKATETELLEKKDQVLSELKLLKGSYEQIVLKNKGIEEDLLEAQNKIDKYIDSLQDSKVSISSLLRFKSQAFALAKERDLLLRKNDSLLQINKTIQKDLDSVSVKLTSTTAKVDSLAQQANKLKKVVEEGSALQINKLIAEAVKGSKNKTTDRGRAADKIRICFTVVANKIAKAGSKTFYIKVTAPSGITLGANDTQSVANITVNFSTAPHFIYDNKSVDVCDFISKTSKEFEKGAYKITVYDDNLNEVGSTDLVLK